MAPLTGQQTKRFAQRPELQEGPKLDRRFVQNSGKNNCFFATISF